jgi:N6-adenosine-specific RNA methylase IME4
MSRKTYHVIYADPPWRYSFSQSKSRKIENQYPTMDVEDICDMDIPSARNSVLYLWATAPKLIEALQVMEAWGFCYKTHAIWDKEKIGMGYWFRGQHELLLVGVKGNFSPPNAGLRIGSVIRGQRGKHSNKPNKIRDYLTLCYPKYKKLELFARTRTKEWDVFGNEILPDVEIEALSDSKKIDTSKIFECF